MINGQPAALSLRGLSMAYGANTVLEGIDLDLPAGKVLALLGASGSGKTTLLRLIAGLLMPVAGTIDIAGRTVADPAKGIAAPPEKRGLGMVFQDYALWPHLSVAQNVSFPLEMMRLPAAERKARVARALERVSLSDFAERRPSDLSGGQQQRVAIARAIVGEPRLVLFDEPLSNLDRELREAMVDELGALVAELELSAVYVTHDHAEALALAEQIAVMRNGGIEQLATPAELIDSPRTAAVADFLRLGCLLPVRRSGAGWVIEGTSTALPGDGPEGASADVLLPERGLSLGGDGGAGLRAEVLGVQVRSSGFALTLQICGTAHRIRLVSPQPARPGEVLDLSYSPDALRWFPPSG
jgi:iron(III) transport system ATP-binding protein